ncbi:hypothetical protein BD770DRAFT_107038 [Pilaira anomala]|nr:hypothetical protein BD770DRAFT_107038 [Pilaira anomala]
MPSVFPKSNLIKPLKKSEKETKMLINVCKDHIKNHFTRTLRKRLEKKKYLLDKGKNHLPKLVTKARRLFFLQTLDNDGFLKGIRKSKASFNKLYHLLKDHPNYQSTSPMSRMTDVRLQMAVVLERLGTFGNGSSCGRLARRSGIGIK